MRSTQWLLGSGLCLAALALGAAGQAEPGDAAARLEAAVAAHPDDPDLLWALARHHLEHGEPERAAQELARFEARWPQRRPDAARERGRALFEAGRFSEAVAALERATRAAPDDASAQLLLGLALRETGQLRRAEQALARAAQLDPELRGESLMLRGLGRLEGGDEHAAQRLFREVLAADPGSEAAARAERLLDRGAGAPVAPPRRLELTADGGFEWDSNVTLESGTDLPGTTSDRRDGRWLFGASLLWRPSFGERGGLALGYRFDQSMHDTLDEFDLQSHVLHASLSHAPRPRLGLRLDLWGNSSHLHNDRYLRSGGLRPNLFLGLGGRRGVLRVFGEAERRSYHEEVSLGSLERNGWVYGGGLEHYLGLGGASERFAALGARYARTDTGAERDVFGFGPAFDHHLWEATLRLRSPLGFAFTGELDLGFGYEDYTRTSVVDFLTAGGTGTLDPNLRRDRVFDARLAVSRPVGEQLDLELAWRRLDRRSNVDLYRYDRDILGVYLRARAF